MLAVVTLLWRGRSRLAAGRGLAKRRSSLAVVVAGCSKAARCRSGGREVGMPGMREVDLGLVVGLGVRPGEEVSLRLRVIVTVGGKRATYVFLRHGGNVWMCLRSE